jgi:hypothetical protein
MGGYFETGEESEGYGIVQEDGEVLLTRIL